VLSLDAVIQGCSIGQQLKNERFRRWEGMFSHDIITGTSPLYQSNLSFTQTKP